MFEPGRPPKEREKEKRKDRREQKCPNNPHPPQAQQALAPLLSKPQDAPAPQVCRDIKIHFARKLKSGPKTTGFFLLCVFWVYCKSRKENPQKLTQLSSRSKTPRWEKDSTKRHHHRHHKRQPGEQHFPKQVVTG